MAYVLAIEPHPDQARILRDEIRARARTRLRVTHSLKDALHAIDHEVPALVLVNRLLPLQDEYQLEAKLRELPPVAVPQVLFLPPLAAGAAAAPKRSLFGFAKQEPASVNCDAATFAVQVCEYLGDPNRAGADRRTAPRIETVDWATMFVNTAAVELIDLSATGAQIRSPLALTPGNPVQVLLKSGADSVQCRAKVVWGVPETTVNGGYRTGLTVAADDRKSVEWLWDLSVRKSR